LIIILKLVSQAKGIECDTSISKISEDELREILVKVRELRKKNKKQEAAKQEEGYVYKGM
jgi:proteasome assembly chaperone (PAC2) family protein